MASPAGASVGWLSGICNQQHCECRSKDSSRHVPWHEMGETMSMTRLSLPDAGQPIPLLLIDDDRSLAVLLTEYCSAAGFSISSALSGEDGLARSRQQHFFLIILDVMMPGIDGFEVLKRLRQSTNIPVLMLTTRDAGVDRVRGLEAG